MSPYKRLQQQLADANATIRELKHNAPSGGDVFELRAQLEEATQRAAALETRNDELRREVSVLKGALLAVGHLAGHYFATGKEGDSASPVASRVPRYTGPR